MRMRWLILTLLTVAGGCDLGMDLDGVGDAFSCNDCWELQGGDWSTVLAPSGPDPVLEDAAPCGSPECP